MKRRPEQAGFTVVEATVALAIMALGGLLVAQALASSHGAAQADTNKSRAVRAGDGCLRVLGQEISQSTARIDPELPPGEQQRLWILSNGVRFQKVVGYTPGPDGSLKQLWSPMIVYAHNPGNGTIVRTQVGGASRVVARGVTQFAVATTPSDQVVVTIETRMGAANRGEDGMHRRMVRFTPHNGLR